MALSLGLLLQATPVNADDLYGQIRGTVVDQSGAVIQGAKIVAMNVGTDAKYSTTSSDDGEFVLLELPIGEYNTVVEKLGFATSRAVGIHLDLNRVYTMQVQMKVGPEKEQVQVRTVEAQVVTNTPQVGMVVDASQIVNLPLIGRDWINLQQLEAGVGLRTFRNSESLREPELKIYVPEPNIGTAKSIS
jgi:Carboxypeptidase regulatory-like domain